MTRQNTDLLRKKLNKVQARGGTVWSNYRKSNLQMYKHIAEIYVWWRQANKLKGFLDAEYEKLPVQFRQTNQLINFIPLFWLVWGTTNCNKDIASRHCKAMNKIHDEYESKARYYSKEADYKLAKFIEANNGINGLCDYKKQELDTEEAFYAEEDALKQDSYLKILSTSTNKSLLTETEETEVVYDKAKSFYTTQPTQPSVNLSTDIATNDDDLSLILVKKTAVGYELLGATNDAALVKAVTVANFKQNQNAIPQSIKCIVEVLRTQSLPQNLIKLTSDLIEMTSGKTPKPMYKRLLYRADTKDFLLSNVRTGVGVVTAVKPIVDNFYSSNGDIFMSPLSTKIIERKLLSNHSFNLYELKGEEKYDFGVEKLFRLQNIFNYTDFLHLDFWKFEASNNLPLSQVDVADDALDTLSWQNTLDIGFFRQLAVKVLDKWFATHGKFIKRLKGELCQLTFEQRKLVIEFVYVNTLFEVKHELPFAKSTKSISKTVLRFKTKDVMPVLRAIADFNTNAIMVRANNNILQFEFANETATYTISVPTINNKGTRNTKAFKNYKVNVCQPNSFEIDDFDYATDTVVG